MRGHRKRRNRQRPQRPCLRHRLLDELAFRSIPVWLVQRACGAEGARACAAGIPYEPPGIADDHRYVAEGACKCDIDDGGESAA